MYAVESNIIRLGLFEQIFLPYLLTQLTRKCELDFHYMKGVSMHRSGIWILACILMGCSLNVFAAEAVLDDAEVISDDEGLNMSAGMNGEEDVLYNVSFPADIHAYLDPGNLSGRGQIFSAQYAVENYGNTDIAIRIKNIDVYYASTEDVYEFSDEEIEDNSSGVKKMNIRMAWGNEKEGTERTLCLSEGIRDEEVLVLEASEYDENGEFVSLQEGSSGYFYFTGTLNANPNIEWEEGELVVCFDYEILSTGEEEREDEIPDPKNASEEVTQEEKQEEATDMPEPSIDEEIKEETEESGQEETDKEAEPDQKEADKEVGLGTEDTNIEDGTEPSETEEEPIYGTDAGTTDRTGDSIAGTGVFAESLQ